MKNGPVRGEVPMKMVIFHSYVKSPEGKWRFPKMGVPQLSSILDWDVP